MKTFIFDENMSYYHIDGEKKRFRRKFPQYLDSVIEFLTSERRKIENDKNWNRSARKQSRFWNNYDNIIKKSEKLTPIRANFLPLGEDKENHRPVRKDDLLNAIDKMLMAINKQKDNADEWVDAITFLGAGNNFVRNVGGLDYTPEAEEMNENLVKFLKKCKNVLSRGKYLSDGAVKLLTFLDIKESNDEKLLKAIDEKIEKATEKSAALDSINLASNFFFQNEFVKREPMKEAYKDILRILKKDEDVDFDNIKLLNVYEYSDDEEDKKEPTEAKPSTDSPTEAKPSTDSPTETYNHQLDELIKLNSPKAYRNMMKARKKKALTTPPEEEPVPKSPDEVEAIPSTTETTESGPPEVEITKPISKKVKKKGKRLKDMTKILTTPPEEEPVPKSPDEVDETVSTTETTESVEPIEAAPAPAPADPKKTIARIEKVSSGVFDIINQFGSLPEIINDMTENLSYIPMDKYEEVADVFAEQLSYATDKEGNKLFNSKSEARRFLDNLRMRNPRRYRLPKAITKEIKEKQPLVLTPMIKRHLVPIHHERGIYQF